MTKRQQPANAGETEPLETEPHRHVAETVHIVLQKAGVPFEIERQVCKDCARILDEKPIRRTTA